MSAFEDIEAIGPLRVWDDVVAREVHGEQSTLAVVELAAGAVVPEHHHANEQLGLVIRGSVEFRVGTETQETFGALECDIQAFRAVGICAANDDKIGILPCRHCGFQLLLHDLRRNDSAGRCRAWLFALPRLIFEQYPRNASSF